MSTDSFVVPSKKRARTVTIDSNVVTKPHTWSKRDLDTEVARVLRKKYITGFKPELKSIEVSLAGQAMPAAGAMLLMSGITEGVTSGTRVGVKVKLVKCEISYNFSIANATGTGDSYQISVFSYKSPNGVAPTAYTGGSAAKCPYFTGPGAPIMLHPDEYAEEFRYFLEVGGALNPNLAGTILNMTTPVYKHMPLNIVTQYNNANGGTIADCIQNALYFGYCSYGANAKVYMTARVWYSDV